MLYDFTILGFYLKSTPGAATAGLRGFGKNLALLLLFVEFMPILPILPVFTSVSEIFKTGGSSLYVATAGVLRYIINVLK